MKNIKLYIENISFCFKIIINASRKLFIAKIVISIVTILSTFLNLILIKDIINLLGSLNTRLAFIYMGIFCILVLVENLCNKFSKKVNYLYEDYINLYLDETIVDKVSQMKYSNFDQSEVLNRISDTWELINAVQSLPELLFSFAVGVGKIIVSIFVLSKLNIFVGVIIVAFVWVSVQLYKKANDVKWNTERNAIQNIRMMEYYKECLGKRGFFNMLIFHYNDFFINKYKSVWKQWYKRRRTLSRYTIVISCLSVVSITVAEVIILTFTLSRYISGKLLIGDVFFFFSLVQELKSACEGFVFGGAGLMYAMEEVLAVRDLLNMDSVDKLGTDETPKKYEITFCNVWFKYPQQSEYVLKDCSFTIHSEEVIGLVGENGAGKSTIVKLILALYEPTRGKILLNGREYSNYDIFELRRKMGVMFQDYNKYSLTLKENVGLAEVENIEDIDMLIESIARSGCDEILDELDCNYDTQLTKRFDKNGIEFSGGQWQKIAVARAFFGNKSLYLLDEPSASLDPIAEDKIITAFQELVRGKCGIIVTHRLSSLNIVDRILVLANGEIVESGNQKELLDLKGVYAEFYTKQANRYA